ncbi:DUF5780 domain-containing protein [Clostridium sp. UBA5988]|uniref:DUF5780 domain-containing protein n=1 Tax=Clostridium sp. UBA5988 TaxID=1946369 RepID=UPI0032178A76
MSKKYFIFILLGICMFLVGCGATKLDKTTTYISESNFEKAIKSYESLSGEDKVKIDDILKSKIDEQYNKFVSKEIEKQVTIEEIIKFKDFNGVSQIIKETEDKINKIDSSRTNFEMGQKLEKEGKMEDALVNYKAVYVLDKDNYGTAQSKITTLETAVENEKTELLKKQMKEENKKYAVTTSIVPSQFDLYDGIQVMIKNNTDATVKEFRVGVFIYDKNGLPIKSGILAGGDIYMTVKETNANIMPGESWGSDRVIDTYLDNGTVGYAKACLIEVIDYDGKKWTNPYESQWYLDNYDKKYK